MKKNPAFIALFGIILLAVIILIQLGDFQLASLNLINNGKFILPLLVVTAFVDSLNPCALSVLLLTIAFLFSLGKLRSDILKVGWSYVFGILLVYILIGLGILHVLQAFNTPHIMSKIGASLLIAWGLIMLLNEVFPNFPIKLRIPRSAHPRIAKLIEKTSLPAAFVLGAVVGLYEFPCVGGPYLFILSLLHDNATYLKGLIYLLLYNAIFVLPLVVVLYIASNKTLFDKFQEWKKNKGKRIQLWGGLIMIILGFIIFIL